MNHHLNSYLTKFLDDVIRVVMIVSNCDEKHAKERVIDSICNVERSFINKELPFGCALAKVCNWG